MHYTGLAVVHHLLVFGLVVMLAMQLAYLRSDPVPLKRLSALDAGYGGAAVLVFLVGLVRVIWGEKGWLFYQDNPFFWAKLATFMAIGLISVVPTMTFIRWNKATRTDAAAVPSAQAVGRIAGLVRIEVLLLFPLVAFAAAMTRWAG